MTKKEVIKDIFNEKINKDQIYNEVLLKSERKEMKKSLKYILAPTCILIIVVCGILLINQKNNLKPIINDGKDLIYINKTNNQVSNSLDAKKAMIEPNATIKGGKFEVIEELKNYPFYKNLEISNEYNAFVIYALYVKEDTTDQEYNKLNNYVISYKVKDAEKEFKSIEIAFSKESEPLRDYYFESKSDKKSTINGIEMKIHQYETSYMTTFKYNDINFDIETHNISETELINLIKSIIK